MDKKEFIPLIQAACYLAYEKNVYDKWLEDSPSKRPAQAWVLYVGKNAPAQKFERFAVGEPNRIMPCRQIGHKDRHREKIRKELIKIIKYAAAHDGEILKGKTPDKSGYSTIPSDFLLLVNDGLSIIGDINLNHSDFLVFDGKNFKAKCSDKKCPFMHEYYRDVLVDWNLIHERFGKPSLISKSDVQEISIGIMEELISERGELKSGSADWINNTHLYSAVWEVWSKQYDKEEPPPLSTLKGHYAEFKRRRKRSS